MGVKWKIFFGLNFILAIPAFVALLYLLINFSTSYNNNSDRFFFAVSISVLLLIVANSFLNIYTIQRFFPDKLLPTVMKRVNIISMILNFIVAAGMAVLCIYLAALVFSSNNVRRDTSAKVAVAIFCSACLIDFVILILQAQLPSFISRNNREKINSLINSIGNPF